MLKSGLVLFSLFFSLTIKSQATVYELDTEKEKKYMPYLIYRHHGKEELEQFKIEHPEEYLKELWYFSSSFFIRPNYFKDGEELDASTIDITRFEQKRKYMEESIVVFEGFKDVLVLLPGKDLFYKP